MQTTPGCVCSCCLPDAGVVQGIGFLLPISVASVSFVILILRKAIELLGLQPKGLRFATDLQTAKATAVPSYSTAVMLRLEIRRWAACPLGETCPIHLPLTRLSTAISRNPRIRPLNFFLKRLSTPDGNSHLHLVGLGEVLFNPKMS